MRAATWLTGAGLVGCLVLAGTLAAPTAPARAEQWCGFHQKAGSPVRCGYSSIEDCKQSVAAKGDKDAKDITCLPDPAFARNARHGLGHRVQL